MGGGDASGGGRASHVSRFTCLSPLPHPLAPQIPCIGSIGSMRTKSERGTPTTPTTPTRLRPTTRIAPNTTRIALLGLILRV